MQTLSESVYQNFYKFGEWYPIESAPKNRKLLLLVPGFKLPFIGHWNFASAEFEYFLFENEPYTPPSHWAKLLEVPKNVFT